MARKETLLPPEEFVRRAVLRLRKGQAKSIHSVFSGFNAAWRQYYNTDPVEGVKALEEMGVCVTHPTRGGVRIYLAEDAPSRRPSTEEVAEILKVTRRTLRRRLDRLPSGRLLRILK